MKPSRFFAYTSLVILVAGGAIWYIINDYYERQDAKPQLTELVMYKNPGCKCCTKWAQYLEHNGFNVTIKPSNQMPAIKADKGVPYQLSSCHTAVVDGYVVEGHVPVQEIYRLLAQRPDAIGIAVPGMPQGSPGMETGRVEPYQVILFEENGNQKVYANYP